MLPAAMLREGRQTLDPHLGDYDEIQRLPDVPGRAVELIQEGDAGRARTFLARKVGGRTAFRLRARIVPVAREHHVVDDQRVLALQEELRELDLPRPAVGVDGIERIILANQSTRR